MQCVVMKPVWPAFDLIKCICAVGMVLVHGFYWTWTMHGRFILPPDSLWFITFQRGMFLGVCPLTLPFLAGAALRLRYSQPSDKRVPTKMLGMLTLQSALLAALGYAMNVLAAGWYVLWAWNVLLEDRIRPWITETNWLPKVEGYARRLKELGLITMETNEYEYRFKDLIDLDSREVLFTVEHETRSMTNPMYGRPLINRNPAQTNTDYKPGHDTLAWAMP